MAEGDRIACPYLLFAGSLLGQARGGWDDFIERYDSLQMALRGCGTEQMVRGRAFEWAHIVDFKTGEIVMRTDKALGYWEEVRNAD